MRLDMGAVSFAVKTCSQGVFSTANKSICFRGCGLELNHSQSVLSPPFMTVLCDHVSLAYTTPQRELVKRRQGLTQEIHSPHSGAGRPRTDHRCTRCNATSPHPPFSLPAPASPAGGTSSQLGVNLLVCLERWPQPTPRHRIQIVANPLAYLAHIPFPSLCATPASAMIHTTAIANTPPERPPAIPRTGDARGQAVLTSDRSLVSTCRPVSPLH